MSFADDYNSSQSTLAYGKHINRYGKLVVMKALIHIIASADKHDENLSKLESAFRDLPSDIDEAWTRVLSKADVRSTEGLCMLAYEAIGCDRNSLLYSLITTYAKVAPLKSETEWFDNFRLTAISNSMNLLIWRDDVDGVYGVGREPKPIDERFDLNYARVKRFLVKPLREFIIKQSLFPESLDDAVASRKPSGEASSQVRSSGGRSVSSLELSNKEVCDECYRHYPFFLGGAHGCDVFTMPDSSLSIKEISAFCRRYPSAIVGYILNTETYTSGKGQHWVAIAFSNDRCSLINSTGRGLESFHDGGELANSIRQNFAAINFNPESLQNDGYSCGMFSVISLYMLICFNMDVSEAVNHIGVNGNKISAGRSIYDYTQALALNSERTIYDIVQEGGSELEITSASATPSIVSYLLNEVDAIETTLTGGGSNSRFEAFKLPAINKQLSNYANSARDAVEQEVYEELLDELKSFEFKSSSHRIELPSFNASIRAYDTSNIKSSLSDIQRFNNEVLEYKQQLKKALSLQFIAAEYKQLAAYKRLELSFNEFAKTRIEQLLHI